MTNQLTYIKKLNSIINVNVDAISNLSSIIKNNIIDSHQKFQQTKRDILVTLNYSWTKYMTNAFKHVIAGKLPLSLINPFTIHDILKNISLRLPEGYELITGTKLGNFPIRISNGTFVNIYLNFHILELITSNAVTFCLQKWNLVIAHKIVLQYVLLTQQYRALK